MEPTTVTVHQPGQHVKVKSGVVHLITGVVSGMAYAPCATGTRVETGVATDEPVTCKICAKRAARRASA